MILPIILTLFFTRRAQLRREQINHGKAGEHRQRDRQLRHNLRENGGPTLRQEVGGDASARHRLLPAAISQHLPRRPALGNGRARVAAQEPLPAAGTQHFHVRPDGDQYCIRCVHCIPAAVL